jgi:hypothetical protein
MNMSYATFMLDFCDQCRDYTGGFGCSKCLLANEAVKAGRPCGRCGKPLTDPADVQPGYTGAGLVCAACQAAHVRDLGEWREETRSRVYIAGLGI